MIIKESRQGAHNTANKQAFVRSRLAVAMAWHELRFINEWICTPV